MQIVTSLHNGCFASVFPIPQFLPRPSHRFPACKYERRKHRARKQKKAIYLVMKWKEEWNKNWKLKINWIRRCFRIFLMRYLLEIFTCSACSWSLGHLYTVACTPQSSRSSCIMKVREKILYSLCENLHWTLIMILYHKFT